MKVNGSAQTDEALGGWNGWTLGSFVVLAVHSHWWTNVVWLISNLSFKSHVFLNKNHHFLFDKFPVCTVHILFIYIYIYVCIYIKYLHISTYLCCVTPTFSSGAPSFPSIAPEKYEAGPPCWRSSVQGRGNDLTATETREWWLVGVTIPKWPHFRLVNYSNLPIYIYDIYIYMIYGFNIHMSYEHDGVSPDSLGWFKSTSTGSSSVEKQNHFQILSWGSWSVTPRRADLGDFFEMRMRDLARAHRRLEPEPSTWTLKRLRQDWMNYEWIQWITKKVIEIVTFPIKHSGSFHSYEMQHLQISTSPNKLCWIWFVKLRTTILN